MDPTITRQQPQLTASDGAGADLFGKVALFGDTALIGAGHDAVGANTAQGSAYVFLVITSVVGDFDGDSVSDILWRHAGTGKNVICFSGLSFTPAILTQLTDQYWQVQ